MQVKKGRKILGMFMAVILLLQSVPMYGMEEAKNGIDQYSEKSMTTTEGALDVEALEAQEEVELNIPDRFVRELIFEALDRIELGLSKREDPVTGALPENSNYALYESDRELLEQINTLYIHNMTVEWFRDYGEEISLEGLDILKGLQNLQMSGNIKNIDLKNENLREVYIESPFVDTLKIGSKKLKGLTFASEPAEENPLIEENGSIEEIDLSNYINLDRLIIEASIIKRIDVSNNKKLRLINITGNTVQGYVTKPTELNLENNVELESLYIGENHLMELDLSKNTKLKYLSVGKSKVQDIIYYEEQGDGTYTVDLNQINQLPSGTRFDASRVTNVRSEENSWEHNSEENSWEHNYDIDLDYNPVSGIVTLDEISKTNETLWYAYDTKGPDSINYNYAMGPFELKISERPKYRVTFYNKDNDIISEEVLYEGKAATEPEAPVVEGYIFTGWDKEFSEVMEDLDIYPLYEEDRNNNGIIDQEEMLSVRFLQQIGDAPEEQIGETQEVLLGTAATEPEAPVVDGYTFTGWDKEFSNVTEDLDVYAVFEKEDTSEGGNPDGGDNPNTGGGGGGGIILPATKLTIHALAGEGGDISPDGKITVREGSDKTFTITANDGYRVQDVLVNGESVGAVTDYTFEDVRKNQKIEAIFETVELEEPRDGDYVALIEDDHRAYMRGYPNNLFMPDNQMTRAEVVVMFSRLLKDPMTADVNYTATFTDVDSTMWFANQVAYMENLGIVQGYPDGSFKPNAPVTRAEFAAIADKFDTKTQSTETNFADLDDSHWAKSVIDSVYSRGWIVGYENNTIRPDSYISRAESVTITNRVLERNCDLDETEGKYTDVALAHWAYGDIYEASSGLQIFNDGDNSAVAHVVE